MGVDGLDWVRLREGIARGALPHFAEVLGSGAYAEVAVRSAVPGLSSTEHGMVSPVLWTSVASGCYYFRHGVYDFRNGMLGAYPPPLFESSHVRAARIWDILTLHDMASLVVGYYVTHPAYPIKGVMVSDLFGEVQSRDAVWPPSRLDELAARLGSTDYEALLRDWSTIGQESVVLSNAPQQSEGMAEFERDILHRFTGLSEDEIARLYSTENPRFGQLIRYRLIYPYLRDDRFHRLFLTLLPEENWRFATVYYRLVDFVSHGFWERGHAFSDDYLRRYGQVVDKAYAWIDQCLGEIRAGLRPGDRLVILSDHGFTAKPGDQHLTDTGDISDFGYAEHAEPAVLIVAGGPARGEIRNVSLLDIGPSILDALGLAHAETFDGGPVPKLLHADAPRALPRVPEYPYTPPQLSASMTPGEEQAILSRLAALGYIE